MNTVKPITSKRLTLVPCSLEHGKAVIKDIKNIEKLLRVRVNMEWPSAPTKEFLPKYIQRIEVNPSELGWGIWFIIHKADQMLIGDIGFHTPPNLRGNVEIGFSIVKAYRNDGYGTEAGIALIKWAFRNPNIQRVKATCRVGNYPSRRVLEKLGMKQTEQFEKDQIRYAIDRKLYENLYFDE